MGEAAGERFLEWLESGLKHNSAQWQVSARSGPQDGPRSEPGSRTIMTESPKPEVTAAVLVIGDEILSGRTKDKNIGYIAEYLTALGIDLKEVRVVGDEEAEIVAAVNALRSRYGYLFTTAGTGPTHTHIPTHPNPPPSPLPLHSHPH